MAAEQEVDVQTGKLVDHRAYDKQAYMSSDYKTKYIDVSHNYDFSA